MTRASHAVAALTAVIALLAAACSTGDSPASSGTSTVVETTTTSPPPRGEAVPVPTVSGPITGGVYDLPFNPMPARLADGFDYVEEEYFFSGEARSYRPEGEWGDDGRWSVVPGEPAAYETRLLVRRPADPGRFDGVVVVEWLNVSAGMDSDPDFGFAHAELMRRGAAWVGVSAQRVGVEGGGFEIPIEGFDSRPLKAWDPQRYGSLDHPGDDFSYDIFSQAAQAIRRPGGVDPLGGLDAEIVLAVGESQSAMRMLTYANAVHPVADIYDGFLIHSRGASGAPIAADAPDAIPEVAFVRDDLDVPVMQVETETDLFGLGFVAARQSDTAGLRTWEIAGAAHADQHTLDYGFESGRQWDDTTELDFAAMCGGPLNQGPQTYVVRAALAGLITWVRDGVAPASAEPLALTADDTAIARDDVGNALGGVRTPAVDVPIAALSGEPRPGASVICSLFGSTTPLPVDELARRYPTHDDYVGAVEAAARTAVEAGHLLDVDAEEIVADADGAAVPS